MENVNKKELVSRVAEKAGITIKEAGVSVNAILDVVTEALVNGEKVGITGFGSLEVKDTAERNGRNPKTGEEITIPASKRVSFKAGKQLKEAVK